MKMKKTKSILVLLAALGVGVAEAVVDVEGLRVELGVEGEDGDRLARLLGAQLFV